MLWYFIVKSHQDIGHIDSFGRIIGVRCSLPLSCLETGSSTFADTQGITGKLCGGSWWNVQLEGDLAEVKCIKLLLLLLFLRICIMPCRRFTVINYNMEIKCERKLNEIWNEREIKIYSPAPFFFFKTWILGSRSDKGEKCLGPVRTMSTLEIPWQLAYDKSRLTTWLSVQQ